MYDFTYQRATSRDDAAVKLAAAAEGAYLAGGMTLLATMKQRLANPSDLVDLGGIGDLTGIHRDGDSVVVGAMASHAAVAADADLRSAIPALADLVGGIGDPQVRNRGTIGGSIANADPAADYPAAVVALGATVCTTAREIAADDMFTGMFETALNEGELITEVSFPVPEAACYAKFANPASRYAIVGVMVAVTGGSVRVAVTGAGSSVFRAADMEQALADNFSADAIAGVNVPADGLNTDIHAAADYRAHLINVMARRAVTGCL
ncbi:MAG: FAD binding domain-containing protein [Alphaproteobacteria bacterium]|jgi:carbon-monoxide dehydrogenase medium subunit|nr:FAD binding domain-containing protein [Alphaproteobacteria bacterium]MDP6238228.1 FAD binding domain-containing protein [Alphaproteobacteria bacterium]|tara:strand:+ start:556 stop:1350 length:795 start_codon:yes stop_codon:yes gene_type:complete